MRDTGYRLMRYILLVVIIAGLIYLLKAHIVNASTVLTKKGGVNTFEGHQETYYNLKMDRIIQRAQDKGIPGLYWENPEGIKMYGYFVIVAADWNEHPYGSTVNTSKGWGIVLDTGDFVRRDSTLIDIATNW